MGVMVREDLRGRELDPLCMEAEEVVDNGRELCLGFYLAGTDEPEGECAACGAFVGNVKDFHMEGG